MGEDYPKELDNKVIIMNGFSQEELVSIMRAVRRLFDNPRDLIFAKTTPKSVNMVLKDLIVDMSEDHEYLKNNPPEQVRKQQQQQQQASEQQTAQEGDETSNSDGTEEQDD